jgi:hypothetical protein
VRFHPVTLWIIHVVGSAAYERIRRGDTQHDWEYFGCRRDCLTVSQSSLSYCIAFGAG